MQRQPLEISTQKYVGVITSFTSTYLYTMSVLKVQFEKVERGYNVSIDDGAMVCYESREATWEAIYSAVKDVEFTDTKIEFNGMPVPSMDRLVLLVKYML